MERSCEMVVVVVGVAKNEGSSSSIPSFSVSGLCWLWPIKEEWDLMIFFFVLYFQLLSEFGFFQIPVSQ